MDAPRPDPDELLERLKREEQAAARGKLKVFFGSSAGVGKTYAMLGAARALRAEGRDVVAGVVETHGRGETAALLEGLEVLPPREVAHKGVTVREFDIDAALSRRPSLVLVDELAHTNAPGSRHPKRWQDVEELLAEGIDVYTTLNVQHLESLNDVVGGITGIRVWETVPDTFFEAADEVVLVDIPADELLARLKAGKVYIPEQAERAAANFFRKGNLMALRELALRRTADVVEEDVQAYRSDQDIEKVWKTEAALLACIGPSPGAEHVVRSAARLASQLAVEWTAVYVETPRLQRLPPPERERILKIVKLAQDLGAKTAILAGGDPAEAIVEYARSNNLSKVILGRSSRRRWPWRQTLGEAIAAAATDIDLVEIGRGGVEFGAPVAVPVARVEEEDPKKSARRLRYVGAALACVITTAVAALLFPYFELANIVMFFLLAVVLVAVRWGREAAILAAVLNVVSFDFFFVPPRFSFAVSDAEYLVTFGVMLAVGVLTGHLTAGLRYQVRVASHREERARTLYEFARDLSGLLTTEQVIATSEAFMARAFRARVAVLVPDAEERLASPTGHAMTNPADSATAQWTYDQSQAAGAGTDTLPGNESLFLPLKAPMRTRGVLAIRPERMRDLLVPEQRRQYETFSALVAIALERVHYVEIARDALIKIESERLRNSLLSALSHDLRTPLAALLGLSESLTLTRPPLSEQQEEIARAVSGEARRLIGLVNNLLDMARIQSGEVKLRMDWQSFEEVVGSTLKAMAPVLARHPVTVALQKDLPLAYFDATLMERVLANLLENAAKYTPPGTPITVAARTLGEELVVDVVDEGPGLPPGREEGVFEKFTRGERESATPGVGLGLAICRAIIEAHKGRIVAEAGRAKGARFTITLPLGNAPTLAPADGEACAGRAP